MQFALVRAAAHSVAQGICSAEAVDLVEVIFDYLAPHLCDVQQAPALIRQLETADDKGSKSGQGLFPWGNGEKVFAAPSGHAVARCRPLNRHAVAGMGYGCAWHIDGGNYLEPRNRLTTGS